MKIKKFKLIKTILIIASSIIIAVALVIIFISPIAYSLVSKYSEKYTGRQIKMDWVYVNPFTGYVHISNLKIYESKLNKGYSNGDSIFFSAKGLTAKFAMRKMLSKTIEINELSLNEPRGIAIQNNKIFNFNDLILLFTPKSANNEKTHSPVHFNLLHLTVIKGEFHYREDKIPINYYIQQVNLESTGIQYNKDTIGMKFSFLAGPGSGSCKGNFTINFKTLDYRLATIIKGFDLKFIEQYLRELANYGNFTARLDANIIATGKLNDQEDLNAKGRIEINDFHVGKIPGDDYASFNKMIYILEELSPKNHLYLFDSITIDHPYFKYEIYDYLDNVQRMFGKNGTRISNVKSDPAKFNLILKIADYVVVLSKNFFKSDYRINKLAINKANLKFNDYSLAEEFSLVANPLYIFADSVNRKNLRVKILFKSEIIPFGSVLINLSLNPKDSGDFDMNYHLKKLPVALFNPYLITYTSFPLDRGTIELNGTWKVRNSQIKSDNHLLIIDPRVARRIEDKDTKRLPANLIMFFIREQGNVIDYEVPITGNLKNPKFHLKDVILDILGNIFVKPVTTPYRTEVKSLENDIEKSLTLRWELRQNALLPEQEVFVGRIANFLKRHSEASITVFPILYASREKESLVLFEAKKKFYLSKNQNQKNLTADDSMKVEDMSIRNRLFLKFLVSQLNDSMLFTIQDKCRKLIGMTIINSKYNTSSKEREDAFLSEFKKKSVLNQVKIQSTEDDIPYNGYSYYKIVYKGEIPESLMKADEKMNQFNNTAPRKWFKKEREKNEVNSNK